MNNVQPVNHWWVYIGYSNLMGLTNEIWTNKPRDTNTVMIDQNNSKKKNVLERIIDIKNKSNDKKPPTHFRNLGPKF